MGISFIPVPASSSADPGTLLLRDEYASIFGKFQAWDPGAPAKVIASIEHNFAITSSLEVLSVAADSVITGFAMPGGNVPRTMLWLLIEGTGSLTLLNDDAESVVENRIVVRDGSDYVIPVGGQAFLTYWNGWRVFA